MKFTIVDNVTKQPVRMAVRKPAKDSHLEITNLESSETMVSVFATKGKIGIRVPREDDPNTFVVEMGSKGHVDNPFGVELGDEIPDNQPGLGDDMRNWIVEDDYLKVSHPVTGAVIELPIHKPGPKCPTEHVYEILGQPEMVFSVAFAMSKSQYSFLTGPTGTGKTTIYKWFAKTLGWNYVQQPIARGTESFHMIGDYMPIGPAEFEWVDGPVSEAVRLSESHPTLLVFDELNRIGNIAEFSDIYPMMDDSQLLTLRGKRTKDTHETEQLKVGQLSIGATSNPSDDEHADYIGVQDLDPALSSRFLIQPQIAYPSVEIEAQALLGRIEEGLDEQMAFKMCTAAKRVREAPDVRFPMSFRELVGWALALPFYGFLPAAEVAVINKAPAVFRSSIRDYLKLA